MRTMLISTTAAMLLLSAGVVSAQGIKTDETPGAPAAQQSAPAEKMAPAVKSEQIKAPEKTGQAAPIAPESDNKQQTTDKGAPAGAAAKGSSEAAIPGTQTGGWPRSLRRTRMARLPPSRNAMHRGLWIPDLRAGDDSPLTNSFPPVVHGHYNSRNLSAQRVRHCGLSATFRIPSQLSDGD